MSVGSNFTAESKAVVYQIGSGTHYIDFFRDLSLFNRKLYEQGVVPHLKVECMKTDEEGAEDESMTVSALPNTWQIRQAWKQAKRRWLNQRLEAIEMEGIEEAKFADFKIRYDSAMVSSGALAPYSPANFASSYNSPVYTTNREWTYSEILHPEANDQYQLYMLGDVSSSTAIISGTKYVNMHEMANDAYAVVAEDPDDVAGTQGWAWFNDSLDEAVEINVEDNNDAPPYAPERGIVQEQMFVLDPDNKVSTGWFIAPCGLLCLTGPSSGSYLTKVSIRSTNAPPMATFRKKPVMGYY